VLSFSPVVGIGTLPAPHPQASVPPPPGCGGRGTLADERWVGRVPIPTRGHTLWHSIYNTYIYIFTVCLRQLVTSCLEERVELLEVLAIGDENGELGHPLHGGTYFLKFTTR
jgi:hypothetical protein